MESEYILSLIATAVISVFMYLLKSKVEGIEKKSEQDRAESLASKLLLDVKIRDMEKEMGLLKTNYISRFEALHKDYNEGRLEIMKELGKIYTKLAHHEKD